MTEQQAIERMQYRIDTASEIAGKGEDGKAFEDMEMAIKALERQIGKKISRESLEESYRCPSCNSERSWKDGNYCKDCGRKLEW